MNLTTTENIIKQMDIKKQVDLHVPTTEHSGMKKGQTVIVRENPLDQKSNEIGKGVLTKCNDTKVYHRQNGYENWNVKLEHEEKSNPRIVHPRDIVEG